MMIKFKRGHLFLIQILCVFRSLACILYEMCCMNHAFTGSNFLSIVLKIVEGDTPSLPERYPRQLNAIMERYGKKCIAAEAILNCTYILVHLNNNFLFKHYSMLNKSPSLRPFAIEILKIPYIAEQLQVFKMKGIPGSTY